MRKYSYIAIDSRGVRVSGEIESSDPDAVVSQLSARGLRIESVQLAPEDREQAAARGPRLSAADSREVGSHISEIVSGGLPLEAGLAAIAEEFPRGRLRRTLRSIVADLAVGNDLETVLKRHRTSGFLPALVRAGQRSGRTGDILENFISATQVSAELRQTMGMALAYPLILIVTLGCLLIFLQVFVIPQFGDIFAEFGLKLPVLTTAMLVTSDFLTKYGGWALLVLGGAAAVVAVSLRLALGELATRRVLCRLPVIGALLRWSALARFSPLLSVLIEARVPLDEAIVLAGDAAGDAEIRDDCRRLATGLRSGNTLEQAAAEAGRLPMSFLRALTWERCHEGFPDVLRSMADLYAGRVRALITLLAVMLPPIVFVFVVGVVGAIVVLLFMPLFELLRKLS
ncbi:MAG: type II secretion system F family protein [Planctomycetia bacterium]|nr:type II secretion system F family protein [Planctomycetia bacterium]